MSGKKELKRDRLKALLENLEAEEKTYVDRMDSATCCAELVKSFADLAASDPFTGATPEDYVNEWKKDSTGKSKGCILL